MGKLGDKRSVKRLCNIMLNRKAPLAVRIGAARALGEIGDRRAATPLMEIVTKKHKPVWRVSGEFGMCHTDVTMYLRAAAMESLGKIRYTKAVGPLKAGLSDNYFEVQGAASGALLRIALAYPRRKKLIMEVTRAFTGKLQVKKGAYINDANKRHYLKAVEDIAKAYPEERGVMDEIIQALIQAARERRVNHSYGFQEDSSETLKRIGEPAFVRLLEALKDKDMGVRGGAAFALGHMRDERAVNPLIETLGATKRGKNQSEGRSIRTGSVRENVLWAFVKIVKSHPENQELRQKIVPVVVEAAHHEGQHNYVTWEHRDTLDAILGLATTSEEIRLFKDWLDEGMRRVGKKKDQGTREFVKKFKAKANTRKRKLTVEMDKSPVLDAKIKPPKKGKTTRKARRKTRTS
jgi:HEAT repeat protein